MILPKREESKNLFRKQKNNLETLKAMKNASLRKTGKQENQQQWKATLELLLMTALVIDTLKIGHTD